MYLPLYARFACVETEGGYKLVKEFLVDHLVDSAIAACTLAKRLGVDEISTTLATAVHDLGKVLHNLINRVEIERIESDGCEDTWRLSFRYHEILSAAVYGYYAWFYGEEMRNNAIITRAVLLHHQGLRGLETHIFLDGLAWISMRISSMNSDDRELLMKALVQVIDSVANRLLNCEVKMEELRKCCKSCRGALNVVIERLRSLADMLKRVSIEFILEHASATLYHWIRVPEDLAASARGVSGILMLADNAIAITHCEEESSARLYPEEARWLLLRSINVVCKHQYSITQPSSRTS